MNLFASKSIKQQALFFDHIELYTHRHIGIDTRPHVKAEVEYLEQMKFLRSSFGVSDLNIGKLLEDSIALNAQRAELKKVYEELHEIVEMAESKVLDYLAGCRNTSPAKDNNISSSEFLLHIEWGHEYKNTSPAKDGNISSSEKAASDFRRICSYYSYVGAAVMRVLHQTNAVCLDPFWRQVDSNNIDRLAKQSDLYEILVTGIPLPSEDVPWEDIFSFRSESSSQNQLRALRLWISDLAKGKLSYAEAHEKIAYLKDEYRAHMKGAGVRAKSCMLRVAIIGTAELIENALKIRPKALAESLFKLSDARADLMEAERKAVGRELAYVVRAEDAFRTR